MTDKKIINTCEFFNICESTCGGTLEYTEMCSCYELHKQLDQFRERNNQLVEQNFELAQKYTKLEKEAEKYKQTITEIKEIAEKYKNLNFGEQQYCYSKILQKISESEG